MSAHRDAEGALGELLATVEDQKLRRVIGLIEASGQRPVLEPALAAMRPRLRLLRPRRPLTLARLLTVPFEAALVADDSPHASTAVCRGRLPRWQAAALGRLCPMLVAKSQDAISGRTADDRQATIAAGRDLWPAAAAALAALAEAADPPEALAERRRVADCLAMGAALVPLLDRLLPLPVKLDAEDQAALAAVIALAAEGAPDRLNTLCSILLRAAPRPWLVGALLPELAPVSLQRHLRTAVAGVLIAHRAFLEQLLQRQVAAPASSPVELAAALERLAEALAPGEHAMPGTSLTPGDAAPLRRRAAVLAAERSATALDRLLEPLPPAGSACRAAAQSAREATARALARLNRAASRLAPQGGIAEMTEAAIERLVNVGAARGAARERPIAVEDARLIEILVGPDVAWSYLRPERAPAQAAEQRGAPRPAGR